MVDLEIVRQQILASAERRSMRIMDAVFREEPIVILYQPTTTVDEALDLAQVTCVPFLTLHVTYLDRLHFLESLHLDEHDSLNTHTDLVNLLEEHDGQADRLFVQWIAGGAVYLYVAAPSWSETLDALRENWTEDRAVHHQDEMRDYFVRIATLASALEREPSYRSAAPGKRAPIGRSLLEPLLWPDEHVDMVDSVFKKAHSLAIENRAAAYAELDGQVDELSRELKKTASWLAARSAADRKEAARTYLMERAEAYVPSVALVDKLRRAAE